MCGSNHNMDPTVVGSSQFGQLFKTQLPGTVLFEDGKTYPEGVFHQPLVYTSSTDGVQYVYIATTQNNIYKLNAVTGKILASRNLGVPYTSTDASCGDINPVYGVTGTGVIDPSSDTWYLDSKTYADQSIRPGLSQGSLQARHYLHAININDLSARPGFPVQLKEGHHPRNNPGITFQAGIHHQRPALLLSGKYVYAAYGSHCVKFNYTGLIVGWDKTTGAMVESFAMKGAPVGLEVTGGVSGIWMSGGGLTSDDKGSMFWSTGNGHASQLDQVPVNGKQPPTALEEAAVHATINDDGTITPIDFFIPWEKKALDGDDRDLGTSPLELLPSQFSCGGITRIGVVTGKSGKTYFINMDDMGGYKNGANALDDVIQVYQNTNSVYSGAGVYPLEGGYVYINGKPTLHHLRCPR
jgi:hypothetical protein